MDRKRTGPRASGAAGFDPPEAALDVQVTARCIGDSFAGEEGAGNGQVAAVGRSGFPKHIRLGPGPELPVEAERMA